MRQLALTEMPHPSMALVTYKPLYLNEILRYGFKFDSSSLTDFNMDDFVNVEMYTSENDGFNGVDKDDAFGSGTHVDVEMGVDDVDIFGSVRTHSRDVSKVIKKWRFLFLVIMVLIKL